MPDKDRHNFLINVILGKVVRIKLDIIECSDPYYILTNENYKALQEIKILVTELEELDSLTEPKENGTIKSIKRDC